MRTQLCVSRPCLVSPVSCRLVSCRLSRVACLVSSRVVSSRRIRSCFPCCRCSCPPRLYPTSSRAAARPRVPLDLRLSLSRTTSPVRIVFALRLPASKAPNFLQLGYVCTCTATRWRAAAPPAQHRFGVRARFAVHFHLQRCRAHRRVAQRDWMAYIREHSVISCSLHLHFCYLARYARD